MMMERIGSGRFDLKNGREVGHTILRALENAFVGTDKGKGPDVYLRNIKDGLYQSGISVWLNRYLTGTKGFLTDWNRNLGSNSKLRREELQTWWKNRQWWFYNQEGDAGLELLHSAEDQKGVVPRPGPIDYVILPGEEQEEQKVIRKVTLREKRDVTKPLEKVVNAWVGWEMSKEFYIGTIECDVFLHNESDKLCVYIECKILSENGFSHALGQVLRYAYKHRETLKTPPYWKEGEDAKCKNYAMIIATDKKPSDGQREDAEEYGVRCWWPGQGAEARLRQAIELSKNALEEGVSGEGRVRGH